MWDGFSTRPRPRSGRLGGGGRVENPSHIALRPRQLERTVGLSQTLAARLVDRGVLPAVAEDGFHEESDRGGAVDRTEDRIVAVDHPCAARRGLEVDVAEFLELAVERRLVLQKLQQ